MTTQGQWRWGSDWDEAVRLAQEGGYDEGYPMKYADLSLYCGEEDVVSLRLDHYEAEWEADEELSQPSAEHRALIVRALNAHSDLLAACEELLGWVAGEYGLEVEMIEDSHAKDKSAAGAVWRGRAALAKAEPKD